MQQGTGGVSVDPPVLEESPVEQLNQLGSVESPQVEQQIDEFEESDHIGSERAEPEASYTQSLIQAFESAINFGFDD